MKQSPLKNKPANIKAPRIVSKVKSPGKALAGVSRTNHLVLSSATLAIDSTASKSSLTKRITLPCATGSSTIDTVEPLTPLTSSTTPPTVPPSAPSSDTLTAPTVTAPLTTRSVWYLGGNQIIKLLTSVDGDLDHAVLANIADVPSVVGDLALSVESLVSDDFTVGGFETDLLAKIAANTLAAKRASVIPPGPPLPQPALSDLTLSVPDSHRELNDRPQVHHPLLLPEDPMTMTITTMTSDDDNDDNDDDNDDDNEHHYQEQQQQTIFDSVPNPLADYQPVPNPLARITPPPSPLITIDKPTEVAIPPTAAQMIQAR